MGDRKTETGACANVLGGEKRLKDAIHEVRWHARPVVLDRQLHEVSRGARPDGELAGRGRIHHRLQRIVEQIREQLVDLVRIGGDQREPGIQFERQLGPGGVQFAAAEFGEALGQVVQADIFAVRGLFPRQGKEIQDQLGGAVAFHGGLLEVGARPGIQIVVGKHELEIALDHRERIIQFVGHAGNHPADGGQLFRLPQLFSSWARSVSSSKKN